MTTQTVGVVPEFRLCDRLRRAREITGLDQAAFAAELGISRTSVSNAETGTRRLAAAVLAALALVLLGAAAAAGVEPYDDARPAGPSSAREYAAMWASLPADQWGAGDVSLSVPLGDGRVVWLYGDTMSTGRFVHSSAIVQTGWTLHVSHRGRQVLPDEAPAGSRRIWYWIETARLVQPGLLEVTAGQISGGTSGVWDFHRTRAASRVALVAVAPSGDVDFQRWLRWTPQLDVGNRMTVLGPHHYTYLDKAHPEAELASGQTLWTASQNWDDPAGPQRRTDGSIDFTAYRPIWWEAPDSVRPEWVRIAGGDDADQQAAADRDYDRADAALSEQVAAYRTAETVMTGAREALHAEMRRLYAAGMSAYRLAQVTGLAERHVGRIVSA